MNLFFSKGRKGNLKNMSRTYSIKPLVKSSGTCVFPELAILEYFRGKGYEGLWADAFHKKYWINAGKKCSFDGLKGDYQKIIEEVKELNNGKISGCWDLIIWKDGKTKFVESKGRPCNDRIRESQTDFKNRLMSGGFKEEDFVIVEWDYIDQEKL